MGSDFERRTYEKLYRDLGPVITMALDDPMTVEVMLNPDGQVWQERLGEPLRPIGRMDRYRAEAVLRTLASHLHQEVTRHQPFIEGELPPNGARFAGQLPPVVAAPTFCIRLPASRVFSLAEYCEQGALTLGHYVAIVDAVMARKNILVVGGTGSGKTTLVNAIIEEMVRQVPKDRVVILEDTRELRCTAANAVQYRAGDAATMTDLLRATLRMRPDRLLVGEVRGPEALDLLMAWNTGHSGGAATVHANHARAGLCRLDRLVSMHGSAPQQRVALIAEAVDVVVHIARTAEGRRVTEVLEVVGNRGDEFVTRLLGSR